MDWLIQAYIFTFAGSAILSLTFIHLYFLEKENYLFKWSVSWGFYSARIAFLSFELIFKTGVTAELIIAAGQLAGFLSGYYLIAGIYNFLNKPFKRIYLYFFAIPLISILLGIITDHNILAYLPNYFTIGLFLILTGMVLYKEKNEKFTSKKIISFCFILWGVSKIIHPFLKDIYLISQISFITGFIIEITLAIGMLLIYSQQIRSKIEQSKELLNITEALAKVGGFEWDVQTQKITWTNGLYEIHGTSHNKVPKNFNHMGASLSCYKENDRDFIKSCFQNCLNKGVSYDVELPFITLDNRKSWIRTVGKPVYKNGKIIKITGTVLDITNEKKNYNALLESEERRRLVFEQALDGIVLLEKKTGIIKDCNKAFVKISGFEKKDLIEKDFFIFNPRFENGSFQYIDGSSPELLLAEFTNNNNIHMVVEIKANNVLISGVEYIICMLRDVTEKKIIEDQLKQTHKMEAIGKLAGGIAHDFNNILQSIFGFTEILLLKNNSANDDNAHLNEIFNASQRASTLVKQLLLFSRKMGVKKELIDLSQTIPKAVILLESTLPKIVNIKQIYADDLHNVSADFQQMEQMILNLGSNAADAMPEGGEILIEAANVTLDKHEAKIYEIPEGRYVSLFFSDTGTGIKQSNIEKIFDPFFTTKSLGKGTGLGLASVYGIVQNHSGHIRCYSETGVGTVFKIYLPIAKQDEKPEVVKKDEQIDSGNNETILLVDDEETIRNLGIKILEKFQYNVLTAENGKEAIEVYLENTIDLVLLDINMPVMDGIQCMKKIFEINKYAKIIATSGFYTEKRIEEILSMGALAYIKKPYQIKDLISAVKKGIDT